VVVRLWRMAQTLKSSPDISARYKRVNVVTFPIGLLKKSEARRLMSGQFRRRSAMRIWIFFRIPNRLSTVSALPFICSKALLVLSRMLYFRSMLRAVRLTSSSTSSYFCFIVLAAR